MIIKKLVKVNSIKGQLTESDVRILAMLAVEIGTLKARGHDITSCGESVFDQVIIDSDTDDKCKSIEYMIEHVVASLWCKRELFSMLRFECEQIAALRESRDALTAQHN